MSFSPRDLRASLAHPTTLVAALLVALAACGTPTEDVDFAGSAGAGGQGGEAGSADAGADAAADASDDAAVDVASDASPDGADAHADGGCGAADECPGSDGPCVHRTCVGGACGVAFVGAGQVATTQTAGDCRRLVCDGQGNASAEVDATDAQDDANACTLDACAGDTPTHAPIAAGASCGGGHHCDGQGSCVECSGNPDCSTGLCQGGLCVPASCGDGKKNGSESDVDCGGACAPCGVGAACAKAADCASKSCVANVCAAACGNGQIETGEQCDDRGATGGDGCSASCQVEAGWSCLGAPSTCSTYCGDGLRVGGEPCDDGDHVAGDGCSPICQVEPGWSCAGSPSDCTTTCGDAIVAGAEKCDDKGKADGDGCSALCQIETGWSCPNGSGCSPICGDRLLVGAETCDDGNQTGGDCCSSGCQLEPVCEIEPNDLTTSASDFFALASAGRVKGNVRPATDVDWYFFDVPGGKTANVDVATFDAPGGYTCASNAVDSKIFLADASGTIMGSDDDSGPGYCSQLHRDGLRAGRWYVQVAKSPYASAGNTFGYTLGIDLTLSLCGDDVLQPGEPCDDGGHTNGDGCSSACQLEAKPEPEPNDDCASAPAVGSLPALVSGAISPAGESDWFSFTLGKRADVAIVAWDAARSGDCASGALLQLRGASCASSLGDASPGFDDECARLDAAGEPVLRQLAPGTYRVRVSASASGTTPAYALEVRATSTCGNGVVEGYEPCDGGAGCNADCTRVPKCGDGFLDAPEQCDDGGKADGDGCSASCQVEAVAEKEPNDGPSGALAAIAAVTTSTRFAGTLASSSDWDLYAFTVATPTVVRTELFDASGQDCGASVPSGMYLDVLDASGVMVGVSDQYGAGIGNCAALVQWRATPGTYFVRLGNSSAASPVPYVLQIAFASNAGAESEPNETVAFANALSGTDVFVVGNHPTSSDLDVFAVTVPAGKSLRAEIIEADGGPTCESNDLDSKLTLLAPNGAQLGSDDDGGRGYCSLVDGTGSAPLDAWAQKLAGGTYYVQVGASGSSSKVFPYRLVVTVR